MRFLFRNAIFILFPAVIVAIIFLAQTSVGTAVRFGEWGERSIAESTLIVIREKIERVEHTIRNTDDTLFRVVNPSALEMACDRWRQAVTRTNLIEVAFIIDDFGDIIDFFYRDSDNERRLKQRRLVETEIVPLIDKYDSLDQYKHVHRDVSGEYRFFTHFTTMFEGQDYTSVLMYNTEEIVDGLIGTVLDNVGADRVANVVDDRNQTIFGHPIDGASDFIVARRFPTTLYKWRLQLAPTSSALFSSQAQEQAKRVSKIVLIPLALAVIVLSLVILYLSVVRERRLNRLKSVFVANVSHELKTPLSLIRMFGELLLMGKVDDPSKAKQYHEIILRETERLTSLIDNVLNLSRIERGKGAYEFVDSDVAEAVERAVEICSHRLEKSGLKLAYSAQPNLPLVRIDDRAITLAVVNLIDNAAKYAKGTDIVGVALAARNRSVLIDVYDSGVGIPRAHLKRIFERFFRVPTSETRPQRGSGIGLSLVKHIAEGHGGSIQVTSIPETETRFSIRIPIAEP